MDEYQHSLFFEAKDLTEREVEKIRRHFQKRRDSGGGDCGIIEKAGGNIYKISFKEKEDQERVLQRKFHTISLPSGQLRVTVRRTSSAQKPDQPSGIQSQTLTKANTKGIEKIFKLDIFLLLYLRNNPKANKVLENQLSSIGCTVEFNLVEEKIIVRGDADKGTRGAFASAAEHWEIQVDRVFIRVTESYLCHHVVEPKQVEILLQDLSFVNDGINVYTEGSYAVLVGENEAVKERIAILEKSLPTQRELPVVEKQLKLVEEEFSREMLNSFPEVKIHRSNARIILEGPGREVQSGAAKLDELLKKVKEKRVTLCAALLTFITSSGAISMYEAHFQRNLRNPVLLEVESDLVLSSLSPGALDKAEAALQRDLSLADVPLQGAAALPADLDRVKKVMIQAKNEANSQELRVDVSFIPGPGGAVTKVRLVGFSEHVNKLREVLHDYQMNQVGTQEVLSLPHPELVDCFDKLLNIIGVKQTNVTFKPSHFPYPCVSVSGPRCLVQEAYANLNATLGNLTSDTLTLDGSGAQRYFQAEGKVSKELIETSFQVLIREQQGAYSVTSLLSISSPNTSGTPRPSITRGHCSAGGSNAASKTSLNLKLGSLGDEQYYHDVCRPLSLNMDQEGQAIFRSLPTDLDEITMTVGGGVKLQLVYGDITHETTDAVVNTTDFVNFQIDGVCKDILAIAGPGVEAELKAVKVNRGGVFVSRPGLFPCKAILHVHGEKDASIIERLVCSIVERCETLGFKSVAIPAISTGTGGMDPGVVAGAILRGVKAATSSTPLYSLTDIHLVLNRISIFLLFKEKAMRMFSTAVIERVSAPQLPHVHQPPSSVSADLSILRTTSTSQQSVFLFLGISRQDIEDAMKKLEDLYQAQCSTYTFKKEELAGLTAADMEDLKQLVETEGLYMQCNQSGQGRLTVRGLKDGVNQVMKMINASLHNSLRREVRVRKEEDLYARVAWCIQGHNGKWERLPKTANHKLENKDIAGGIVDAQGISWIVDLHRLEAKRPDAAQTVKLKRLVNLPDFTLPLYWDNMAAGENLKAFVLQPSSAEYQTVKEAFKQTVSKTVVKIERLQNVHLRRAYEVQKRHISEKNRQEGGAVEKLLYHGTTQDNCDSIMKTGFNRSFAGQNATAYGHGTYFAVDACYSAQPTFSKRAADGSQLMFVARVLTGYYTLGQCDMRVPPPRRGLQPHDRFDSVVDNIHNPNMYVVFHDSQAYPDYLITFK